MTADVVQRARERFEAGAFREALEAALSGLEQDSGDVELLRLAGRAGVEVGSADAIEQLQRVAELAPDEAASWHDLGDALAAEGRTDEARDAFRKAVELDPEDAAALAHLGHSSAAVGDRDEALSYLSQAAERQPAGPAGSSAVISLVDMYRAVGEHEQALAAAEQLLEAQPGDVLAALDVAELSLQLDRLDGAERAFERLRESDDVADHDVYGLHGLALVAMRRGDTARALEIAREALAVDERGLSADLALHLEVEAGADGDVLEGRPSSVIARIPPTRDEIEAALLSELAGHRRLHLEDRRLDAEDLGG